MICLRRAEKEDADWRVNKAACILSRDLTPRIQRYNLSNEDIHAGMRFPSGIAAGPVPAEPTGRPAALAILPTILQIDSNIFKAIPRYIRGYCHHTIIATRLQ